MTAGAGRLLFLAIVVGAALGISVFTFHYAEGLSYFSTDPLACKNCHIMNEQYASWTKGPHHAVATCVQCHLPHTLVDKYVAKAENGYHHSKGFTLQDFHEPIMIKQRNAAVLQANCVHCHEDVVHEMLRGSSSTDDAATCVHCHRNVGHGARG
ncbi:MAG TPA: cytochrome c nitrite reductase small subunit [Candidatus Krumholzibacteria bacterium]|nr:cytochrome c nitrite reductase small subunit [Candidatus Krumholzibacteria bacterium]